MALANHRSPDWSVVFDGQSLNLLPVYPGANSFPTKSMAGLMAPYVVPAVGSTSWTQLALSQSIRCNPHAHSGRQTVLVMNGGTSDVDNNESGATMYAAAKNYAVAAKAAGFNKVLCTTILKSGGMSGAQDTARQAGNALIVANGDAAFDAVLDIAGQPNLQDPTNTTYFMVDAVHWNATGCQIGATLCSTALAAIGVK